MGPNEQCTDEFEAAPAEATPPRPLVRPSLLRLLGASCVALVGVLVFDQVVASGSPAIAAHTASLTTAHTAQPSVRHTPLSNVARPHHSRPGRVRHHVVILPVTPAPAVHSTPTDTASIARAASIVHAASIAKQEQLAHAAAAAKAAKIARQQQLAKVAEIAKQQQQLAQQQLQQQATQPTKPAKRDTTKRTSTTSTAAAPLLLSLTSNVDPSPNFMASCGTPSNSVFCLGQEIEAIDNARAIEGLGPMTLSVSAFVSLSAPQQIFVLTNLERTSRGLAPAQALTAQLNSLATTAAAQDADPALKGWTLTGHKQAVAWNSNWSGGLTATSADYYWMYSDGAGYNVDCTASNTSGCWEHRSNILSAPAETCGSPSEQPQFVMGAAEATTASYSPSDTEIIVQVCGGLPSDAVFTWTQAQRLLSVSAS